MDIFFIVSAMRSGSTMLARICDAATNCQCAVEPHPNAQIITGQLMRGKLKSSDKWIKSELLPTIEKKEKEGIEVYGEKDPSYNTFTPSLYEILGCKLVFIIRDGRDVVKSMINWHTEKNGSVYVECKDKVVLSDVAKKIREVYRHGKPPFLPDYARPRPKKGEPLYNEWEDLTRFEMCSYYWAKMNEICLENLNNIPNKDWITVDLGLSNPLLDILKMVKFLNLKGLNEEKLKLMLESKINSLQYHGLKEGRFPHWSEWDSKTTKKFWEIAGDMMIRLGYKKWE